MHRFLFSFTLVLTASVAQAQSLNIPAGDLIAMKQAVEPAMLANLLEKLASPDFREREEAGAAVVALGDRALPQLQNVLKDIKDYEVARRLGVIVREFQEKRLTSARMVTLKGQQLLPREALQMLALQTGYRMSFDQIQNTEADKNRYSFNLDKVPFWQAMDAVCNASGLDMYIQDDSGLMQFNYSDTHNPYIAYSGPFRFMAQNINTGKTLNMARISRKEAQVLPPESIYLSMMVMAEPKTQILNVKSSVLVKAIDEQGREVKHDPNASNQVNYGYGYGYRSYGQSINIALTRPSKDSKMLKEITGKAQLVVLSEVRPEVVVEDILKVKNKKYIGRLNELEYTQADDNNGNVAIQLTVKQRSPSDPNDYGWANSIIQRFELTDAKGVKYTQNGWSNHNYSQTAISMTLNFAKPAVAHVGPPTKLTLMEWVTVTQDAEFMLKNVELP